MAHGNLEFLTPLNRACNEVGIDTLFTGNWREQEVSFSMGNGIRVGVMCSPYEEVPLATEVRFMGRTLLRYVEYDSIDVSLLLDELIEWLELHILEEVLGTRLNQLKQVALVCRMGV